MIRLYSKNATGVAPDGRWYAGDINALQDAVAGISDFTQFIDLAGIRIGEPGLQLLRYGTNEARMTGAVRTDGIVRALGGLYAGAFTTVQRDAIVAGFRPFGLVILNTTANRFEWNAGTDTTPNWKALGIDPAGAADFYPQTALNYFLTSRRLGDNNPRFRIREDGRQEWGDGNLVTDTRIERTAAGQLAINNDPIVTQSVASASAIPAGVGPLPFAGDGTVVPVGWFLCDGRAISRTAYAALFAVIGTVYGVGDGSTTFNIPDMRGKAPYGKATSGTLGTLGASGGQVDHVHSSPVHGHSVSVTVNNFSGNTGGPSSSAAVGVSGAQSIANDAHVHGMTHGHTASGSAGNNSAANTGTANPPYVVVNYIIKY